MNENSLLAFEFAKNLNPYDEYSIDKFINDFVVANYIYLDRLSWIPVGIDFTNNKIFLLNLGTGEVEYEVEYLSIKDFISNIYSSQITSDEDHIYIGLEQAVSKKYVYPFLNEVMERL